jgi:hypothetical protein
MATEDIYDDYPEDEREPTPIFDDLRGVTLRDVFAMAALGWWGPAGMINRINMLGAARDCYALADAMLLAREEKK